MNRAQKLFLLIAALVLAVAGALWIAVGKPDSSLNFKTVSFQTTDAASTRVDFQISKNPDQSAVCAVQAMDGTYAVVGFKYVEIGPNSAEAGAEQGRTTQQRVTLRTESEAVTGLVQNCWITG